MWGAVVAILALAAPPQSDVTLTGRVVRIVGRDTVGVSGARVVLHRVMPSRQGPVDSTLSRQDGAFSFRFHPDSGAIFLTSARWAGIEYFAPPAVLPTAPARPEPMVLVVADTSSRAPVHIAARHIVVSTPAADGTRAVLELIVLENPGPLTRVAPDTSSPSWVVHLPPDAIGFQLGDNDFAADALLLVDGGLQIRAPLPPGQREITVQYQLRSGLRRWSIPVTDTIAAMNVMAEEPTARLTGGLVAVEAQTVEGKRFSRWKGAVVPGAPVELAFDFVGTPAWLLPALVGGLGIALLVALWLAWRASHRIPVVAIAAQSTSLTPEADALLTRIAALDQTFSGGAAAHPPQAWQEYLALRAHLKQELQAHLPP
ncbi:MAG: hypothetical protein ABIZ70_02805 [Gemmatimonadales bacterium]